MVSDSTGFSGGGITISESNLNNECSFGCSYYFGKQPASSLSAEWLALLELLYFSRNFISDQDSRIMIMSDSDIIVNSLNQDTSTVDFKDPNVMKYFNLAKALINSRRAKMKIDHIYREYNRNSDWLASNALTIRSAQSLKYDLKIHNESYNQFQLTNSSSTVLDVSGVLFLYCNTHLISSCYNNIYENLRAFIKYDQIKLECRLELPTADRSTHHHNDRSTLDCINTFAIDINCDVQNISNNIITVSIEDIISKNILYNNDINMPQLMKPNIQWYAINNSSQLPSTIPIIPIINLAFIKMNSELQLHSFAFTKSNEQDLFLLTECIQSLSRRNLILKTLQQKEKFKFIKYDNISTNELLLYHSSSLLQATIPLLLVNELSIYSNKDFELTFLQTAIIIGNSKMVSYLITQVGKQCGILDILLVSNTQVDSNICFYNCLHLAVLSRRVGTVSQMLRAVAEQITLDNYILIRNLKKQKQKLTIPIVLDDSKSNQETMTTSPYHTWKEILFMLLHQVDHKGRTALELAKHTQQDSMIREILKFQNKL